MPASQAIYFVCVNFFLYLVLIVFETNYLRIRQTDSHRISIKGKIGIMDLFTFIFRFHIPKRIG